MLVLSAVVEDDSDATASATSAAATAAAAAAAAPATPGEASRSPVTGKRTLKNIKTMFFVGTEVSWLLLCLCVCI